MKFNLTKKQKGLEPSKNEKSSTAPDTHYYIVVIIVSGNKMQNAK